MACELCACRQPLHLCQPPLHELLLLLLRWAPQGVSAITIGCEGLSVTCGRNYLFAGGAQLVHVIGRGERFPLNFGREVAALLASTPDRWWPPPDCTPSPSH